MRFVSPSGGEDCLRWTCFGEDLSLTAKGGNRTKCQLDIKIWVKENLFVLNSEQESRGAITHPFRKMREKDGASGQTGGRVYNHRRFRGQKGNLG